MRDAQRGITEPLYDLKAKNLAVHSGTIDDHAIGDSASPILVSMAIFKIVRVTSEQPSPSGS
ncbi:hypothetical protein ACFVXW_16140 [Streptomyces sp. NPDC058251]|uniref:hypothetical protein n=1 Tax=Streptomyces sp. NPDC058251 TaxID=3346404 RepID=UPI0036E7B234